uniref:Uncharacterized protein n=1 Tax=Rangifer tarandus platyrhynchus TaxID=3082113 RepID=A0ACB0E4J4_RANTA|nr:unnamed protein product [Rangifer tarandus platyrhynchus]
MPSMPAPPPGTPASRGRPGPDAQHPVGSEEIPVPRTWQFSNWTEHISILETVWGGSGDARAPPVHAGDAEASVQAGFEQPRRAGP